MDGMRRWRGDEVMSCGAIERGKENIGQKYITPLSPHSRGEGFRGEGGIGAESPNQREKEVH